MEDGTKRYSVRSSVICSMASRLLTCFASASCLEGDLVRLSCGTGPAKNYAATTAEVAGLIDRASGNHWQHINALYWSVIPAAIHGVLDNIRTILTELISELVGT